MAQKIRFSYGTDCVYNFSLIKIISAQNVFAYFLLFS